MKKRILKGSVLALATAALAVPVAQAKVDQGSGPVTAATPTLVTHSYGLGGAVGDHVVAAALAQPGLSADDRAGVRGPGAAPLAVSAPSASSGFDWSWASAGIGAGSALVVGLFAGG